MARNLSSVLYRELENLDRHPDSRREAMKVLKSYVKDLDSKAIPMFLARVSETKELGSASGDCTISLFEALARSHGCNIVPHIDTIMDTIMKNLSSSAGSFALHQACSKVVSAISRYGIDPLKPESEKARIICSLCKPLSDVLMDPQESTASGAALCLTALVESDNWRFASDDVVNEICLRVAGALEETRTQTNSHMCLVMALLKHNSLIVDAYARSLVRSGSQILTACVEERNSQKRLSAIQMINFLMKCVDSRSISSEIASIVNVMEKCQNDRMPFVRGAAFEALQTAKIIAGQKGTQYEVSSSPVLSLNFERTTDSKNPQTGRRGIAQFGVNISAEFPSPELQSVDSFVDYDACVDSPLSIGQSSCNFDSGRRANRRLLNNDVGNADVSLKDGLFNETGSRSDGSIVYSEGHRDNKLDETHKECAVTLSGSLQPTARNLLMKSSNPSLQRFGQQLVGNDVKSTYSTPRRITQYLHNSTPTSPEVRWDRYDHSDNMNHEAQGRSNECIKRPSMQQEGVYDAEPVTSRAEFAPSTSNLQEEGSAFRSTERQDNNTFPTVKTQRRGFGKAAVSFICCLFVIILAIIVSSGDDQKAFHVVPT